MSVDSAPAKLSESLLPLRGKRRGDPINADDWNTVVLACLSILETVQNEQESARARLEASYARREHEHLGEVALSWLDPELQQRLGTSVDAEGRALVSTLEKKVDELTAQVKSLQDANAALESRLDRIAASDVDRNLTIRNLGKRVEAFGDFDVRLARLNTDVAKLSPKLDDVFKLRENLTDEQGAPIKLIDLRSDIRSLQRLGDQLTGIDGTPIKITDIQQQIRDLRDVAGLGQGLEPRFAEISAGIEKNVNDKLETSIRNLEDTLVAKQETRVTNSVSAKVTEAIAAQNNAIDIRLNSIEQNVTQTVSASLDTRISAAVDTEVGDLDARVKTAVDQATADLPAMVESFARTEVAKLDVPKLVTTATAQAEQRITSSVTLLVNTETANRTKAINETVNSLRGEIVATSTTEVELLRRENDIRFKTIETRLPR